MADRGREEEDEDCETNGGRSGKACGRRGFGMGLAFGFGCARALGGGGLSLVGEAHGLPRGGGLSSSSSEMGLVGGLLRAGLDASFELEADEGLNFAGLGVGWLVRVLLEADAGGGRVDEGALFSFGASPVAGLFFLNFMFFRTPSRLAEWSIILSTSRTGRCGDLDFSLSDDASESSSSSLPVKSS